MEWKDMNTVYIRYVAGQGWQWSNDQVDWSKIFTTDGEAKADAKRQVIRQEGGRIDDSRWNFIEITSEVKGETK
jgi:hypothetical protein